MKFIYKTNENNTITITGCDRDVEVLIIPKEIDKMVVTSIGANAFWNCANLTSVTIPDSVTSIGDCAFYSCRSLTSVTIPDSVTSIGKFAFYSCESLISVTIPNSITSIGESAFVWCSSLTSVIIPDSVTSIGESAFNSCSNLTSVTIPNSVTSIGRSAFAYCSSLTSIAIPNSVTSIEKWAFKGCSSLTSVIIPDSVTSIRDEVFFDCSNLKTKKSNYKAFSLIDGKLVCIDYIFAENEWSDVVGNIELCKRGYHYCENLFEIFNYYSGELDKGIAIYECEVGDKVLHSDTSKCCTNRIKPVKRLYREDVIKILNGGD